LIGIGNRAHKHPAQNIPAFNQLRCIYFGLDPAPPFAVTLPASYEPGIAIAAIMPATNILINYPIAPREFGFGKNLFGFGFDNLLPHAPILELIDFI
jgi:hypothetical protein